eukprot:Platyproteum_vivax@DN5422_c0_g1_i1.p1
MVLKLPYRNLTVTFANLRGDAKAKQNRWGESILGGALSSPTASLSTDAGAQSLLRGSDDEGLEMNELPPRWVDFITEANDDISQIRQKLSQLQKVQQKKLLKVFGTTDGGRDPDIERLCKDLTTLFKRCEDHISRIQTSGTCSASAPNSDLQLRKNAQTNYATQLQGLSQQYRSIQLDYMQEIRRRRGQTNLFDEPTKVQTKQLTDQGFTAVQLQELERIEVDVNTRTEEIDSVVQSVHDLHNIFKDLSMLVIDQGTILDRIDYNIDQVVTQTTQARTHVLKAEEYQKNSRLTSCVAALVIGIVIMLVLLILKWS